MTSQIEPLPAGSRILHIGPPKTGTTSLQAAFHAQRDLVERQGLHYAGRTRHAMTEVFAALGRPTPWSGERKPAPRWRWSLLLRDIRASRAPRVLLSSELFADGDADAIARIVRDLDPTRLQVVLTLRPLARIMPSQWQQYVQQGYAGTFDTWLDAMLNKPSGSVTPSFWHRHRHGDLVARWADAVGSDRVTVVALDDRDRDMVYRVFERLTGLESGTLAAEPDLSNRSLTLPEIEVIRAINLEFRARKLPTTLYSRAMRYGTSAEMKSRTPAPDEARIELPAWAVEPVAAVAREAIVSIRASGVRVVGDLDALAAVPAGSAGVGPVPISPSVAASAALGMLVASGLARGTGSIDAVDVMDSRVDDAGGDGASPPSVARRAPMPIREPPELLRISTSQLGIVIIRRIRAAIVGSMTGALGRRRPAG